MKREVVRVALCGLLVTCLSVAMVVPSFASEAQSETQGIVERLDKKPVLGNIAQQLPAAASIAVETQKWNNKAVSNIEGESAIYLEESEESSIVGKLYTNTIVDVEEKGEIWSKVSSGEVVGYIKNEVLAFGSTAVERANAVCPEHAVIEQEGVQLKTLPEESAEVKTTAEVGAQYLVVEDEGQWLVLKDSDETNVYVSKDQVSITRNSQTAKTVEQIAAEEEAARKAAEEAARKAAEEEAARKAAEEEAARKAAEEAAAEEAAAKKAATEQKSAMAASADDRTLLAAIIYCEAGSEPYEGKVAVGAVVLNRVRSGRYPNSIRGVIYQKGQFGPASTGKLDRVISSGKTTQACFDAADAALAGANPIGDCLHFGNGNSGYKIGSHYFH